MSWDDSEGFRPPTAATRSARTRGRPGPSRPDRGRRLHGRGLARHQEHRGERHDRFRAEARGRERRRREGGHARTSSPPRAPEAALGVAGSQINVKNGEFDDATTYSPRATADDAGRFQFPRAGQGLPAPHHAPAPATPRSSRRPNGARCGSSASSPGPGWKGPSGSAGRRRPNVPLELKSAAATPTARACRGSSPSTRRPPAPTDGSSSTA